MKDAGMRIRVDRELRAAFVAACKAKNRPASDVLREFMQSYVERHQGFYREARATMALKKLEL